MAKKFEFKTDSRIERLAEIAKFIDHAAHACGLGEDACHDVQLAADEACANVIEHAYQGKTDGKIKIACEQRGNEFVIVIQDAGKPFDPRRVARPDTAAPLTQRDIGGLGVFFIHKLMDRVDFDFRRGHNVLTMRKKIKG